MYRRDAILTAGAMLLAPQATAGAALASLPAVEEITVPADRLASWKLRAVQDSQPDSWQALSYIGCGNWSKNVAILYWVSQDRRLIEMFGARLTYAMERLKLPVYGVGTAGPFDSHGGGYNAVVVLYVSRAGLAAAEPAFVDLLAKYPAP